MLRKFATVTFEPQAIVTPDDLTKRSARKLASDLSLPENLVLPGKVLLSTRAISNRVNDNGDFFGSDELHGKYAGRDSGNEEFGYKTFIGKPVFLDHNNTDYDDPRGRIIAAMIFDDPWDEKVASRYPRMDYTEHEPRDTWVKIYHEIDADRYPKTAEAVIRGLIKATSMGCDVEFSKCSICENKATTVHEYCEHIGEGSKLSRRYALDDGLERYAYERNHGLQFFEDSLLTVPPADPSADILSVVSSEKSDQGQSELNRSTRESVSDWRERRADLIKSAYTTQVAFPSKMSKVARRNDVVLSSVDRRDALSDKRKVRTHADNGKYRLFVTASNPGRIWIKDKANGNEAFYGEASITPISSRELKKEFQTDDFKAYASALFSKLEAMKRRAKLRRQAEEGNEKVQEKSPADFMSEPMDEAGTPDKAYMSVMEHAPAPSLGMEPADASEQAEMGMTVQDQLPAGSDVAAAENSDAMVDPMKEGVVVAKRSKRHIRTHARKLIKSASTAGELRNALAMLIANGGTKREVEAGMRRLAAATGYSRAQVITLIKKAMEDDDEYENGDAEASDEPEDDEDSEEEAEGEDEDMEDEDEESMKYASRRRRKTVPRRRRRTAMPSPAELSGNPQLMSDGGEMEKSPHVNTFDKGMQEPIPAPQNNTPLQDDVDPAGSSVNAWEQVTVEQAGLQRPIEDGMQMTPTPPSAEDQKMASRRLQAIVNRRVAAQTNKIWDALKLSQHRVRLGQVKEERMLVEARKLFDKQAHSDIRAQIKVYADLTTRKEATLGKTANAGRKTLAQPIMTKVAKVNSNRKTEDVAFQSAFID